MRQVPSRRRRRIVSSEVLRLERLIQAREMKLKDARRKLAEAKAREEKVTA